MSAGFRRHLVGKTLTNVCYCDITKIRFVGKSMLVLTFFSNQLIEFYLNNTINFRPLTPHICHVIPTKWRSYRGHRYCDITSPYVYTQVSTQHGASIPVDSLPACAQRSWPPAGRTGLPRLNLATYRVRAFAYTPVLRPESLCLWVSRTVITLHLLLNEILRPSSSPNTTTLSAFEVSHKNALYKSTVIVILSVAESCRLFVVGERSDHEMAPLRGGHIVAVTEPVIRVADGAIFCLRTTVAGHYKCYRQVIFTGAVKMRDRKMQERKMEDRIYWSHTWAFRFFWCPLAEIPLRDVVLVQTFFTPFSCKCPVKETARKTKFTHFRAEPQHKYLSSFRNANNSRKLETLC